MPVETDIDNLSTTASSNNPPGSEATFPLLDNYLRQIQAFIATLRDLTDGTASPTLLSPTINGTISSSGGLLITPAVTFGKTLSLPATMAFTSTPAFDFTTSNRIEFGVLTGNVSGATLASLAPGQCGEIFVKQDGTGGRTFNFTSGFYVAGSVGTLPNQVSVLSVRHWNTVAYIAAWTVLAQV